MDIDLAKKNDALRINIYHKITLIFGIIVAIIFSGIYIYLNNTLKKNTYEGIRAKIKKEVSLTRSLLEADSIQRLRSQELDKIADETGRDLGLRVTIIGLDGTVLGDSELDKQALRAVENHLYRPEVQEALKSDFGESRRFSTTIKKDMLYMACTFGKDNPQGIVRLAMPLSEIELISNRLKKILVISFLPAFILTIIASFIASLFISKPIKEMSRIAKDIAGGDLSKRLSISANDETGDLVKAFNYMAEQIRLRIDEITSSKSRLEAVLLSMFEGVMVIDSMGTILLMNQTLKEFFLVKQESLGKRPLEIIRNIEIQEIADSVLKLKPGVISREISILLPEEKILLVHATPVIKEKTTEGAVLVFHDITELRSLEKIRQDFVANVSHELRTPISSIKGYAETLLEGAIEDKDNIRDFISIIYQDSNRLASLIDDLLDLSRIESDKMKLVLLPLEVKQILTSTIGVLEKSAKEKSIAIALDIPDGLPKVLADDKRLSQVFLNLLDNAVKYTPDNGLVKINAYAKEKFVQIDISDTGIGIPEKDLIRIFERFYRVDKARSRELGGTGLGLSIVKHIVQAHGGQVWVKSELGRDSTFSFTIPKA